MESSENLFDYYDNEVPASRLRLKNIFNSINEDWPRLNGRNLELYYDYIKDKVTFPFLAEWTQVLEPGVTEVIDIEVNGIEDPDITADLDLHGLVCSVTTGDFLFKIPLSEVVIKSYESSYNLIEDYCIWYWESKSV